MPAWVAKASSNSACLPSACSVFRSCSSSALNGCRSFSDGSLAASSFTRSIRKNTCTCIGCSHHSVPSLSKVAMRSAGGTKSGPPSFVTRATKSRIADFAAPSFQEGRGPTIDLPSVTKSDGRRDRSRRPQDSSVAAAHRLAHRLQRIVDGEGVRLLDRREVLERLRPFRRDRLRGEDEVVVIEEPVVIRVRGDVRELVRVGPQVEELGQAQLGERLRPDLQRALAALLHEHDLPVVVADARARRRRR